MDDGSIGKGTSAAEKLRQYVERVELIEADLDALRDEKKAVFADAKAAGFIPKAMRKVLKVRAMAPSTRAEEELLEDTYLHALGLEQSSDLARAAALIEVDVAARESVIAALKRFTPANGSIEIEAGGLRTRLTRDLAGNVTEAAVSEPAKAEPVVTLPRARSRAGSAAGGQAVPDCDREGAEQLGREAYAANLSITRNPFPRDDDRRERWDKGWRAALFKGRDEGGKGDA